MKKKLLFFIACLIVGSTSVFAQSFGAGNLVVYRYGDGSAYTNGQLVPVFLDEYTTAGVLVKTRKIPSVANGANKALTGLLKLSSTGKYQQEGMSTLSQDGKYLTIFGYNALVGQTVPTSADALVVGVIAADGSINTQTTLSGDPTTGLGAPRSAIIDGTNIWANGYVNGVQYTTLNGTTSTRVSTAQNSPTTLAIYAGSLIAPIASSSTLAYATPLPTTSTTFSLRNGVANGTNNTINQLIEFPFSDRKLYYAIDDINNEIRRYNTNAAGTDLVYRVSIPSTGTSLLKSITGVSNVVGANTVFTLYVTSWGDDGTGSGTSKLYTFTETFATQTSGINNSLSSTPLTLLATAPAGTVFRSVTFAPQGSTAIGTGTLPVSLTSFKGIKKVDAIQLNWSTVSEKNNSHFDVLRSSDGVKFSSIGKVNGKGNSDELVNYSFIDANPLSGTDYYQLNQVDLNGQSEKSNIVAVASGLKTSDMTVYTNQSANEVKLSIFSENAGNATVSIYNLGGKTLIRKTLTLSKGYNNITLPVSLGSGMFVATLQTPTETISRKFTN
nr:T9SS type A sorting domain-containing protein [uncultured Pedobacter sp.]